MNPSDSDLLRSYVEEGSETAFAEVVRRHLGLVHGAAVRLLDGDLAAAADVAQGVFIDLARKAGSLVMHGSVAGWLHTSTRFEAAKHRRSEARRSTRELATSIMNTHGDEDSPAWTEMRPVIDEAFHGLPGTDREAVLLRFSESLSLVEVGNRLGVTEDAARKRVDRALERLRDLLRQRGITSVSTAALTLALLQSAASATPAGLLQQITRTALTEAARAVPSVAPAAVTGSMLAWFLGWPAKVAIVAALTAIVATSALWKSAPPAAATENPSVGMATANKSRPAHAPTFSAAAAADPTMPPATTEDTTDQLRLLLRLESAATGQPVAGAEVGFRCWADGRVIVKKLSSDTKGLCPVYYPPDSIILELTSRITGLADAQLKWTPKNGELIPQNYRLRLAQAVPIGGIVVDDQGQPVAGAKIGFNHDDDPANYKAPESHEFGWIEVESDAKGRWRIDRMAHDIVSRIRGGAKHAEYGPSDYLEVSRKPDQLALLKDQTHRFTLKLGVVIKGSVVDEKGNPIPDAAILVGRVSESDRREGRSDSIGNFRIAGVGAGLKPVSASSRGFSPATQVVDATNGIPHVRLVLTEGKTLRVKVTDKNGIPIANASLWYDSLNNPMDAPKIQADFRGRTDPDGRVTWTHAPSGSLSFRVSASGYMARGTWKIEADDLEHVVTLDPALRLRGDVRDTANGQLIPKFRLVLGWRESTGKARFSTIGRFHVDYDGGEFDKLMEEGTMGGANPPPCIFKIVAAGYAPFISRGIAWDEGDVVIPVTLKRESTSTLTFLNPDGSPAAFTSAAAIRPGTTVLLKPGSLGEEPNSESFMRTDAAGQIVLPSDESTTMIVAAGEGGYGEFPANVAQAGKPLQLHAWGRIEGTLLSKGKPVPEGSVTLWRAAALLRGSFQVSSSAFETKADKAGRFVIPKAPPGDWMIVPVWVTQHNPTSRSSITGNPEPISIPAGETVKVVVGASGTHIVFSPISSDGAKVISTVKTTIFASATTLGGGPPKEALGSPNRLIQWYQSNANSAQRVKRNIFTENMGILTAVDVQPGSYVLQVVLADTRVADGGGVVMDLTGKTHAIAQIEFTVPDPAPPEGIDLGEIRLEPVK